MAQRQRFAVHADSDERVAAVEGVDGEPAGVAVEGPTHDLVGPVLDPDLVEQLVEADTEPASVADQATADLVGDTGHGDVGLDEVTAEQVVVAQLQRLADHAVDAQTPGVDRHLGHGQGRVDPVEVRVRRDERRHARHADLDPRRNGGQRAKRTWQHDLCP